MSLSTPRQRPYTSSNSTPGSTASRTRAPAPHLAFSPLSQTGSTRSVSAQSVPSYQPSVASSSFPNTQATRYLSGTSIAPSNLGSVATTANPGSSKFRRGHVRSKVNAQAPTGVTSMNPDLVDLMALDEPDSVFRMFGVRDVRKIEQRASDAANAKVAELRTMVGERYRDLLAAADSIVRMRGAADKLLDCLEGVETAVMTAGDAIKDSAKSRRPSLIVHHSDPTSPRRLADPPTLSLTLHLFLNLTSLVHASIEQSRFLSAARLENLGRVLWRELEGYQPEVDNPAFGGQEQQSLKPVRELFPIVLKHHEGLGQLAPLIVRRSTAELRQSSLSSTAVSQILASLILLDHASPSSALSIFLRARSQALASLLAPPRVSTSKASKTDTQSVQHKVEKVVDCVLRTVEAVNDIFSDDNPLLPRLLKEIEHPSLTSTDPSAAPDPASSCEPKLQPILTTLPNYPTLARHLPNSILTYNPFLSSTASSLPEGEISDSLSTWLKSSSALLLDGVHEWITHLVTTDHPALALARLRDSINQQLAHTTPSLSASAEALRGRLIEVIESRLNQVYTSRLSQFVQNLEPSLRSLLSQLTKNQERAVQETDSARFLFSLEAPTHFGGVLPRSSSGSTPSATIDPFGSFLNKVGKRADGRTPLIDSGLEELERNAAQIREDLKSWLDAQTTTESEGEQGLRERYVKQVRQTLEGIISILENILHDLEENSDPDISSTLFVGTFAQQLSLSRTFTRDLLLGVPPSSPTMLQNWHDRLADLESRSLSRWKEDALRRAIESLRKSSDKSFLVQNSSIFPNEPSFFLHEALNALLRALHNLPLSRLHSTPSPASALLEAFSACALDVAGDFLDLLRNIDGAEDAKRRLVWDVTLIGLLVDGDERKRWEQVTTDLAELLPTAPAQTRQDILQSATRHLLRTQSIYSPLLASSSNSPLALSSDSQHLRGSTRLLPLGPPPPALQGEFKSILGVVQPGSRLGLLPTKG